MPTTDPIEILLAHDRWATGQILDACAKLSDAQFHQRFEMGPGSLHDTLAHMIAAHDVWTHALVGDPNAALAAIQDQRRSPAELAALLKTVADGFANEARRLPLDATVTRVRQGKTFEFPRVVVLTHVATHGAHHRAQCLNMLRQLGVQPLPPSSIAEWWRDGAPGV